MAANPGKQGGKLGADGREVFTRGQAAKFLGLTHEQLRHLHRSNRIRSTRVEGCHLFARHELERYRDQAPGELAARAFELFEAGKTAPQVVIELRADPSAIADLLEAWAKMSGHWTIAGPRGPRRAWEDVYKIGELTPGKMRRALEIVAGVPELRARMLAAEG
jgi:hypothetical protein